MELADPPSVVIWVKWLAPSIAKRLCVWQLYFVLPPNILELVGLPKKIHMHETL
jgi:hypothetical protein